MTKRARDEQASGAGWDAWQQRGKVRVRVRDGVDKVAAARPCVGGGSVRDKDCPFQNSVTGRRPSGYAPRPKAERPS